MIQTPQSAIAIKSIHERAAAADGRRILVEPWWPRGVTWRRAALDGWAQDLAPSAGLRWRLAHDPAHWALFEALYRAELDGRAARIEDLLRAQAGRRLTLLHAARDPARHHVQVLAASMRRLEDRIRTHPRTG